MQPLSFDTSDLWPACVACALQTLSLVLDCGAKFARRTGAYVDLSEVTRQLDRALEADRLACEALSAGDPSKLESAALSAYRAAGAVADRLDRLKEQASPKAESDFVLLRALALAAQKALAPLAGSDSSVE